MEVKVRSVFLETLSWHDKTYGNSYFASRIYVNGNLLAALPFQYGYERMDEQMALELLKKLGHVPEDARSIRQGLEGVDYYRTKNYTNKSDTKKHGEPLPFELGKGI